MSKAQALKDIILQRGLKLAGPIVSSDSLYFAFIKVNQELGKERTPSDNDLDRFAKSLSHQGYIVKFILVDEKRDDLDTRLKTMLVEEFPDWIRNSYSLLEPGVAEIWIEPKGSLAREVMSEIEQSVSILVAKFGFKTKQITFVSNENLPTSTVILRALRISAPCDAKKLETELHGRGFTVPDTEWLAGELNKLVKSGHIMLSKDDIFFLSLRALTLLGSAKLRNSPDLKRALDFARRGA